MVGTVRRRPLALAASCVVLLLVCFSITWTWSAFDATTANTGNAAAAGTVTLTDNDAGSAMFTLSNAVPGDTDTGCIRVTSTGSLPSIVRLYGTTAGTGLDAHLDLVVTRGTLVGGSFDDCTGFTPDATDWAGQGPGVVYSGTLAAFPDDWGTGVVDARPAVPEAWTNGEVHVYRFALTVRDENAAQSKSVSQTFTWEARNTTLYSQVVLSDNPVGYWRLDEAAGTSAADATGAQAGTYTSGPVLDQASGVKDAGTAVTFDGVNDHVAFADAYDFAGTSAFTAEVWVNRGTGNLASWRRVMSKERYVSSSDRGGWSLQINGSGSSAAQAFGFYRWNGTTGEAVADGTTATVAGTWYHVVATYDGTTMRLYVNGVLERSVASALTVENHANQFALARMSNGASQYGGLLDEAAVYDYALSQQQVTEHYGAGRR